VMATPAAAPERATKSLLEWCLANRPGPFYRQNYGAHFNSHVLADVCVVLHKSLIVVDVLSILILQSSWKAVRF